MNAKMAIPLRGAFVRVHILPVGEANHYHYFTLPSPGLTGRF